MLLKTLALLILILSHGRWSYQLAESNIQLCSFCDCYERQRQIECFNERWMEFFNTQSVDFTLRSAHFRGEPLRRLKFLRIDLADFYNHRNSHVVLDVHVFANMSKLEYLFLNKLTDMAELPASLVEATLKLKTLIVHKSDLRRLDPKFCPSKPHLVVLNLAYNLLEDLGGVLHACTNLNSLDVSYNRIKSLNNVFGPYMFLVRIQLDKNEIDELKADDLANLKSVTEFSIARNRISKIEETAFETMSELTRLDLNSNQLYQLPAKSMVYANLVYLNIDENKDLIYFPAVEQFKNLNELNVYYAYHCCAFLGKELVNEDKYELLSRVQHVENETIYDEVINAEPIVEGETSIDVPPGLNSRLIKCYPLPDAFMPCENLLENLALRVSVWLISLAGLLANTSAIVYNAAYSWFMYANARELNVPTYLLAHLACADALMSVYLSFIAVKDMRSRDKFAQSALEWQRSRGCNVAGFLGVVSALASAFCLAFITFERFYAIENSIDSNKRITGRTAVLATGFIWTFAIFLASLPLAQLNLNSYESYALCLPFDTRLLGDRIYLGMLNSIFATCFLFILTCYILIFTRTLLIERRTASHPFGREGEDTRLARNITLLVLVNLICWAPVVVLSARALLFSPKHASPSSEAAATTGEKLGEQKTISLLPSHAVIDRAHLKLIAVFVLPFNSLANPFLYCIGRRRFRMDLVTGWVNYRFRRNLRTSSSVTSVRSFKSNATARTKNGSI